MTSHSPDLLDDPDIPEEALLVVASQNGQTWIGPVDDASKVTMREHLFTAGELLRQDQLAPAASAVSDVRHDRQLGMFDLDPI